MSGALLELSLIATRKPPVASQRLLNGAFRRSEFIRMEIQPVHQCFIHMEFRNGELKTNKIK